MNKKQSQINRYRDLFVARWEEREELGKMGKEDWEIQAPASYGLKKLQE